MKKYIYLLPIAVMSILTGCYDNSPVFESLWVADIKTLPATTSNDDSYITLTGETKMEDGNLYFLLSQNENFSPYESISAYGYYGEKAKTAKINKWQYLGTWYYKLVAKSGGETYDVSNVESFTVENPTTILEPTEITWSTATLNALSQVATLNGQPVRSYFILGESGIGREISVSNYTSTEKGYLYSIQIPSSVKLQEKSEYTVYFCQYLEGVRVMSEPITFRTGQREATPISISSIMGDYYDNAGNLKKIDGGVFNMMIYDNQTGFAIDSPLKIAYNEKTGSYEINGDTFYLQDKHSYAIAVFNGEATFSYKENHFGYIDFNKEYALGKEQNPIMFGVANNLTIDNPKVNVTLRQKNSQIRIKYPAIWGETTFTLVDKQKSLPSYQYYLEALTFDSYGTTDKYSGFSNGKTADGNYYEYVINIWPTYLNPANISVEIKNPLHTFTIPLPTAMNLEAAKKYSMVFDGLSLEDIVVSEWETSNENGTIVIKEKH